MSIDPSHQRFIDDAARDRRREGRRAVMADDIVERLKERANNASKVDWTYASVMDDAAAEIERLRVVDGMLRHGIRQLELDLSVKNTEAERLRASEALAIDDADALCEWLRYYDYPSCRFTTVVGAAIKPACMRALDRRAKKEASDVH